MKTLFKILLLVPILSFSQPSSEGMYFDGVDDFFTVPGTSNINSTTTNNRTYETYFKVTNTTSRQVIMEEGGGTRAVIFYVENGYLVVGAYNRADYTPKWQGTFYRKAITANTWYHFALVFDNAQAANTTTNPMTTTANNALKWYLDGVLQDQISGYEFGSHNATVLGYKDGGLRFPNCGTWTTSGLSEYCFNSNVNDGGSGEYYFQGNLWGYRMWSDVRTATQINDNKDTLITTVGTDDLVAALDGDTFTFLNSSGVPTNVSNANPTTITWKATAASTDWNTGTNWVGDAVPDAAKFESAIIPTSTNYPVITNQVVAGDVEVQTGAEITVNSGGTLDINFDLKNDGTITVENNGSLLTRESKPVSGAGTYIIKRDSPNNPADYFSIWSTPIAEADSELLDIFTSDFVGYTFNAQTAQYVQVGGPYLMKPGEGVFIRPDDVGGVLTRTFTGTINNGVIDQTVYNSTSLDNYHLIGNPYPSAIDWLKFHEDNSDLLSGTMYYWSQSIVGLNNSASDYISFNSTGSNIPGTTGNIGTAQGVFVKSTAAGTITFNNSHRVVANNNQFFRNNNVNNDDGKSWFKLQGPNGFNSILIGFIPGATDGFEDNHDAAFINEGSSVEFYSYIDADKYSIQGRSELQPNQTIEIPLGFEVTTAGNYSISILAEFIDPTFDIMLEDKLENTMTNLRTSDYNFSFANATEDNDRFFLHYNYNATLSNNVFDAETNSIYTVLNNSDILTKVNSADLPKTIQLFDVTGKELINTSFKEKVNSGNLSSGIYIVKYIFSDKEVSKKIIKN